MNIITKFYKDCATNNYVKNINFSNNDKVSMNDIQDKYRVQTNW